MDQNRRKAQMKLTLRRKMCVTSSTPVFSHTQPSDGNSISGERNFPTSASASVERRFGVRRLAAAFLPAGPRASGLIGSEEMIACIGTAAKKVGGRTCKPDSVPRANHK